MSASVPEPARGERSARAPGRAPGLEPPLAPLARALRIGLAWAALVLATPGVVARDGSALVALGGVALWAATASRRGRRAFVVEWAMAGLGSAAVCIWIAYVWSGALAFLVIVPGLYHACAGALLRRLAPRATLALAAPAAWIALELARTLAESPFGYGWQRLGHHLHATWLAGSARVWGTYGLGFVLVAAAGALVELAGRARRAPGGPAAAPLAPRLLRAAPGLALPLVALVVARALPAPASEPGPRLLLVQPAVEQQRKMTLPRPEELFVESLELTRVGLLEARGGGPIDLVAWGETMLPLPLMEEGLEQAFAEGARSPAWTGDALDPVILRWSREREAAWVGRELFGGPLRPASLPPDTAFLSGAEVFVARDGELRRTNAVVLWDRDGERAGLGGKLHLVPGAEHLAGLERLGWVRAAAFALANYVPDLVAFERTAVFELEPARASPSGARAYRFGVSICFDNMFDDPYTAPLRAGPLDFHLVASNEAWFRKSFEADQMVAFSRLLAIQTGRAFVRATNSGITLVLGPDGGEVARLERGGRDRMVPGTLAVTVPVPVDPALRTPYVRFERAWLVLWALLPALVWLAGRRRRPAA